jgi:hypothetical protein
MPFSIIDRTRASAKQQPLVLKCLGGPGALLSSLVLADIEGSMLVLRNVGQLVRTVARVERNADWQS